MSNWTIHYLQISIASLILFLFTEGMLSLVFIVWTFMFMVGAIFSMQADNKMVKLNNEFNRIQREYEHTVNKTMLTLLYDIRANTSNKQKRRKGKNV